MDVIITAVLSVTTGVIGYLFREWQNRVIPFSELLTIEGTMTKATDEVKVEDESHLEIGESCVYIDSLSKEITVGDLSEIRKQCFDIKRKRNILNDEFKKLIETEDSDKIEKLFSRLCSNEDFDNFITKLIAGDRIKPYEFSKTDKSLKFDVTFDEKEEKGSYWIPFQNNTTTLGNNLNIKPLKTKFNNLIDTIKYWEIDGIKHYIKQTQELLDQHYQTAIQLLPITEKLVNESSRWTFKISVTNLNNKPILIDKSALIKVTAKSYKPIKENCYLLILNENGNFVDANSPVVIKPGESIEIGFITEKRQSEMETGMALRGIFDSLNGRFRLILKVKKAGLFRKQSFKTRPEKFVQT